MKILWAPWRMEYISGMKEKGCIFCKRLKVRKDKTNLILFRGKHCFVILNKFPYNHGHLMVVPIRHLAKLASLNKEEKLELFDLAQKSMAILEKEFKAQGFNIGMNLGRVAGAGVKGHLHLHIVPRWAGDTNFMPILAETKVISEDMKRTFKKLNKFKKGL